MATIVLKPLLAFAFSFTAGDLVIFFVSHLHFLFLSLMSPFFLGVLKNGNKTFGSQTHSEKQVEKHEISRYPKHLLLTFIRSLFIKCCVVLHIA